MSETMPRRPTGCAAKHRRRLPWWAVATAPGYKLLIWRRPVKNWTRRTISSLFFCAEKLHMFLEKSTKTAATRAALFDSNIHQIVCRLALRPRCYWGPYSASRDPLAVFRGPTSKRRGGRGEKEKGKGGREFVLCPRKKKKNRCHMRRRHKHTCK